MIERNPDVQQTPDDFNLAVSNKTDSGPERYLIFFSNYLAALVHLLSGSESLIYKFK